MTESAALDTSFFGHPKGLRTLFFTEMWERFSYYGMRALLTLYLSAALIDSETGKELVNPGMGFDKATAGAIYGLYTSFVYLLSLPGGWIADNLWGQRKAVYVGGWIIMIGHFTMAIPTNGTFFAGLVLIILGTGLLKPNVSTIVGDLYGKNDDRRDSGFSIFYMGINIGALAGPLVCGFLAETPADSASSWQSWHYGFGAAGVGMALGLWQYRRGIAAFGDAGVLRTTRSPAEIVKLSRNFWTIATAVGAVIGAFCASVASGFIPIGVSDIAEFLGYAVIGVVAIYFTFLMTAGGHTTEEKKRLGVIMWLFVLIAIFWSGFEQAGTSVTLYTKELTDRVVFDYEVPTSWLQSVNPFFIIVFSPVFAGLWVWLSRVKANPSTPMKAALGLLMLAAGFFVVSWGAANATSTNKAAMSWLVVMYFLHTVGELMISPIGLSATTKLSPPNRLGQMMGIWFVGAALGNLIAGQAAALLEIEPKDDAEGAQEGAATLSEGVAALAEGQVAASAFSTVATLIGVVGILALLASPFVRRLMGNIK